MQGDRQALTLRAVIAVMKTADFGDRDDRSDGRSTGRSLIRRVLFETEVHPTPMVVPNVGIATSVACGSVVV